MPRGSRPGERRGGRNKGTPNKKTLWHNVVASELAKDPYLEPVELFLSLMRTPQLPLALRIDMARRALPFFHAKPRPAPRTPALELKEGDSRPRVKLRLKTEAEDVALDDEWLGIDRDADQPIDVQSLATIAAEEAASLQAEDHGASLQPDLVEVAENALELEPPAVAEDRLVQHAADAPPLQSDDPSIARAEITAPSAAGRAAITTAKVGPMTFLRAIMRHPRTPLHQRLYVASILAPYLRPKPTAAPPSEPSFEVEDQYGFAVDPARAKNLRDLKRARDRGLPHPASAGARSRDEAVKLLTAKIAEEEKTLRCAETYRRHDAEQDEERLSELFRIRDGMGETRPLTPQEDAEEVHLTARVSSYENSAEHAEQEALLDRLDTLYEKWEDYNISNIEQEEFDRLRSILKEPDDDPVESDFEHQVCMEARIRGLPKPSPEEIRKRLAELKSSADIVRRSVRPPALTPDGDIDLAAWLRGEASYQPHLVRKAACAREGKSSDARLDLHLLMIRLVRDEKLVPEDELSPYFSWILYIYDEEVKRGNNPAENLKSRGPDIPFPSSDRSEIMGLRR